MIRFINCIRRKPELSDYEFREYWNSQEFDSLIQRVANSVGALSFDKRLTLIIPENDWVTLIRGSEEPYDATLEYFLENAHDFEESYGTDEFQQISKAMLTYQQQFVDLPNSCGFFTEG